MESAEGEDLKCRFCGEQDGDGHLFGDSTFSPLPLPPPLHPFLPSSLSIFHVRELPEIMPLMMRTAASDVVACSGMVGCLALVWVAIVLPGLPGQLADRCLDTVSGGHLVDSLWSPDVSDVDDLAIEIGEHSCVWTDGNLDSCALADVSVAGAGVHPPAPELAMQGATWGRG